MRRLAVPACPPARSPVWRAGGRCMLRVGMTNPPYILEHLPRVAAVLRDPRVFSYLHVPVNERLRCARSVACGVCGVLLYGVWGVEAHSAHSAHTHTHTHTAPVHPFLHLHTHAGPVGQRRGAAGHAAGVQPRRV